MAIAFLSAASNTACEAVSQAGPFRVIAIVPSDLGPNTARDLTCKPRAQIAIKKLGSLLDVIAVIPDEQSAICRCHAQFSPCSEQYGPKHATHAGRYHFSKVLPSASFC